jgi:hypothetical protein
MERRDVLLYISTGRRSTKSQWDYGMKGSFVMEVGLPGYQLLLGIFDVLVPMNLRIGCLQSVELEEGVCNQKDLNGERKEVPG